MTDRREFLPVRLIACPIGTVLTVDPLADVLDLGRVHGALLASVRAGAPWGLEIPESTGPSDYVPNRPNIRPPEQPELPLEEEEVVVVTEEPAP